MIVSGTEEVSLILRSTKNSTSTGHSQADEPQRCMLKATPCTVPRHYKGSKPSGTAEKARLQVWLTAEWPSSEMY